MKHQCKEFWDLVELAKKHGCKVQETSKSVIKVMPANKSLPFYSCHAGERGIHPLRRFLKNTCKFPI